MAGLLVFRGVPSLDIFLSIIPHKPQQVAANPVSR